MAFSLRPIPHYISIRASCATPELSMQSKSPPSLYVDRALTCRGAGTVVLTARPVELHPSGPLKSPTIRRVRA